MVVSAEMDDAAHATLSLRALSRRVRWSGYGIGREEFTLNRVSNLLTGVLFTKYPHFVPLLLTLLNLAEFVLPSQYSRGFSTNLLVRLKI